MNIDVWRFLQKFSKMNIQMEDSVDIELIKYLESDKIFIDFYELIKPHLMGASTEIVFHAYNSEESRCHIRVNNFETKGSLSLDYLLSISCTIPVNKSLHNMYASYMCSFSLYSNDAGDLYHRSNCISKEPRTSYDAFAEHFIAALRSDIFNDLPK